jgi:hypothetical protein
MLFALGLTGAYRPIFHSVVFRSMFHPVAEIEGFLACFAVGSLFTLLPRRTATSPPARWQMALALFTPVAIEACAALQKWAVGQIAWLLLIGMVFEFSLRRLKSQAAPRHLPEGSVWIWLALLIGAAGAILAAGGEALGTGGFWLHEVGRSLLTQGLFTGFALGTAGLLVSGDEGASRPAAPLSTGWAYAAHAFGGALFFASFWFGQLVSPSLGFALRAAVTLAVVLRLARAPPLSNTPGARARAARVALWMLPVGNAWVVLVPASRRAGMHVIYLGCFATLVLVVSTYLSPSRIDREDRRRAGARRLGLGWACLALALGARILVEIDPLNFKVWLGIACASFVGAMLFVFPSFADRVLQLMQIVRGEGSPNPEDGE